MEYRTLGNSGLQVSVVGLGCNNFGRRVDAEGTRAVVDKAIDLGITFFDTADSYGPRGMSEEFMAPVLKPHRRNVVVATKSASPMGEGPYWGGASRKYLMTALEDCLRRLDTDYIDLYQMHRWDANTPIEETMRTLDDMVTSGKVRYIGCSNYAAWQVVESQWVAKDQHLTGFISAQNQYSVIERGIERELVPACDKYGLGVIPYSPLAGGFLTGKYRPGEPPPDGTRLAGMGPMAGRILNERNYGTLTKLEEFAGRSGHSMTDLAIGWLASQKHVGSVIAGATKPEQVEQNVRAGEYKLDPDDLREVDEILGVNQQGRR